MILIAHRPSRSVKRVVNRWAGKPKSSVSAGPPTPSLVITHAAIESVIGFSVLIQTLLVDAGADRAVIACLTPIPVGNPSSQRAVASRPRKKKRLFEQVFRSFLLTLLSPQVGNRVAKCGGHPTWARHCPMAFGSECCGLGTWKSNTTVGILNIPDPLSGVDNYLAHLVLTTTGQ
ncbi:hypothetical protein ASPVEDRAFT_692389 [Aspergillus versicolor CBS 583.65]|uniref:Uncharacterized protein n=1 Tax=Aspergillus versicolor CBS 583.65 TaxID=1036611 RepID=A0A1L9PMU5_ASPVE|nr:uncharacterized protein ASPVEDRAFT_692389 [Aspergillus versicolor CBS 583.65]OJJ02745.1 hypothetical protein ASPVEDRAFT_692389 [Aspergillus versicolor CBS 583.65]